MLSLQIVFTALLIMTVGLMGFLGSWRTKLGWGAAGVFVWLDLAARQVQHFLSQYNLQVVDVALVALGLFSLVLLSLLRDAQHAGRRAQNMLNQLVDYQAANEFRRAYPDLRLHPITVVIPAYYEAANIVSVLQSIPRRVHGLDVSVLVVVDGSPDGTDQLVRAHGDYVAYVPVNRGQGAALRLGYRLAIDHGARYIVTLDADGQYDPSELDALIEPVLTGEADYVQGSRRMGQYVSDDIVRVLGVYWFNWLIGLLLQQRITDSSNGFRAIKAEVLKDLRLTEDQYHAAELLILAIRKRYRVIERPASMYPRHSGRTKKGHNLTYAYNYARVIFQSWRRAI
jgi:hypothetical protein